MCMHTIEDSAANNRIESQGEVDAYVVIFNHMIVSKKILTGQLPYPIAMCSQPQQVHTIFKYSTSTNVSSFLSLNVYFYFLGDGTHVS